MNAQEVQAWVNRQPALPGSVEYRRLALALGQALDGLQARLAVQPPASPAPLPVVEVIEEPPAEVNRSSRRGPYRRRDRCRRESKRDAQHENTSRSRKARAGRQTSARVQATSSTA